MIAEKEKKDIRSFTQEELEQYFTENNEKAFRAKQIYQWLWQKGARSFAEMTNLSKELRSFLRDNYKFNCILPELSQKSEDNTIKTRFSLHDRHKIEGVLIPSKDRVTACISSQAGCSLSCHFCATGFLDLKRNLDAAEIYDQVFLLREMAKTSYDRSLSNIVYMGMGEPLLNYKNVLRSIDLITDPKGLGISPKRITVSTVGIAKMIKRLGDDKVKFNLALSLHAANDKKRSSIMPINEQNSLDQLLEALAYFYEKTKTRITYEYILLEDFNDGPEDAIELANFTQKIPSKVNIIEYNEISGARFKRASGNRMHYFKERLDRMGVISNVRRSRGKDIDAACGQLANKTKKAVPGP